VAHADPPPPPPAARAAPLTERAAPETERGAPATARLQQQDLGKLQGEIAGVRSYHGEGGRDGVEEGAPLTGRTARSTAKNKAKKMLFTQQKPKPKPKQLCKSAALGRKAPLGSDIVVVQGAPAVQIQTTLSPFLMGDWQAHRDIDRFESF